MAEIWIPTQLRGLCGGTDRLQVDAQTLDDLLRAVDARCPGFYARVVEDGHVRGELAVAINGEAMAYPLGEPIPAGAEVAIVPAIGGGAVSQVA